MRYLLKIGLDFMGESLDVAPYDHGQGDGEQLKLPIGEDRPSLSG
jgi:hypothetical protein